MSPLLSLSHQLALYKAHHMHPTNVAVHLFCIPLILSSALVLLSAPAVNRSLHLPLASVLAALYAAYYLLLHRPAGLIASLYIALSLFISHQLYARFPTADVVHTALTVHVFSWGAQFYAHHAHEKSAPAVLAHPVQPLVLAPFFVVFELLFLLGHYPQLEKDMLVQARRLRADIDKAKHAK